MMVSVVFLAAALSSGNAEFDDVARSGAREIALRRAAAEIAEKGPPSGALEKAMLADPGKFEKEADAKRLCREVFEREAKAAFAAKAKAIDDRLDILTQSRRDSASAFPQQNSAASAHQHLCVKEVFEKAFEKERRSAVEKQAKGLVAIQDSTTGFQRGIFANGADYLPER